jgi:hypothetical protein
MAATVVPHWTAIALSVSPHWTVMELPQLPDADAPPVEVNDAARIATTTIN